MIMPQDMRHTLAGFATGLAVVAAEIDGEVVGMPVNSLGSVSLDPPLVSLSFAHTSTTWPRLGTVSRAVFLARHAGLRFRRDGDIG
ncbi:hypothetical protein FAIPA1_10325 [Frankia sp. AiPs1]|uniref:flavin reductase family protein n=1 Tax=Frankia sp. AiPa1 TaxID=573492 RepID=UPI00202AEDB5|nr:flavin reductase [Frankia sp. AiPa1]MCL9759661.1 flavin reductase family protein [Frankia sp. AiPa1]